LNSGADYPIINAGVTPWERPKRSSPPAEGMKFDDEFFNELKRPNVYKVAAAYAVAGWLTIQVATQVFPFLDIPNGAIRLLILLVALGFPLALVLAWAFEIKREKAACAQSGESKRPRVGAWIYVILLGLALSVALFLLGRSTARSTNPSSTTAPAKSIAVLPFGNLSRDPDNAFFAEGIQDEILTRLAKIGDLKVISRTSTQRFKSSPEDLPQIAKQLGVMNILEGSLQKANDEVRVNAQLINAMTEAHLWAETYDRKLSNMFGVESEIAKAIADTLRAKLTGAELTAMEKQHTQKPQAYQLYLRGRYFWNKRDTTDLQKALGYFEQAAQEDANYALAYSGMADVYVLLPLYGGANPIESYPKAKEAADKAIKLGSNLAEPHAALGLIGAVFDFDFALSMREFERAIALNPNYATAHHWFGDSVLQCIGDFDRSIVQLKRALELDPLSVVITGDLGLAYRFAGHYQEGIAQNRRALEMDPDAYAVHYNLGQIRESSGDLPGAIAEYKKAISLDGDPYPLALLVHAQALAGDREQATRILQQLSSTTRYLPDYGMGLVYLGLGDKSKALDWFENSFAKRQPDLNAIRFDPFS
jgi:adenylate cyclase